ncbi:hypothetical protein LTR95_010177 [Oleoguttula sp. CCFEE 5521]
MLGPMNASTLDDLRRLSRVYAMQSDWAAAEALWQEVVDDALSQLGPDDQRTVDCKRELGTVLMQLVSEERKRLLMTLMRRHNVAARDAVAVADLIDDGYTTDLAIQIRRLMLSCGRDEVYAARIVEIMDAGHTEAIALQAVKLERDDMHPADALAMATLMGRRHSLELA